MWGDDENEEASGGGVQEEAGVSVEQAEGHVPGFAEQIPVMTVVESMRVLLQLGLSILLQVMIGMTLITWHGRKVIFSRK